MNRKQRRAAAKRNMNKLKKQSASKQFAPLPIKPSPGGIKPEVALTTLADMMLDQSKVDINKFCRENTLEYVEHSTVRELAESLDNVPFLRYMWDTYPDKCAVYLASEFDEPFELNDHYFDAFTDLDETEFAKILKFAQVNKEGAKWSTRNTEEAAYVDNQIVYGIFQHWKQYKQIYEFSSNICKELAHTDTQVITKATLESLPYDSFYMDLSNWPDDKLIKGAFIYWHKNEFFKNDRGYCCWIVTVGNDLEPRGYINLVVTENGEVDSTASPYAHSLIAHVKLALIYLSSMKPDVDNSKELHVIKGTHRSKESNWNGVGYHIASDYNPRSHSNMKYVYDEDHVSSVRKPMRPHMRRGHWRTRNNKTFWVRPCYINCNNADELPVFAHNVK